MDRKTVLTWLWDGFEAIAAGIVAGVYMGLLAVWTRSLFQ